MAKKEVTKYKVITLSISGTKNRIHRLNDIVTAANFPGQNIEELIKTGAIKEVTPTDLKELAKKAPKAKTKTDLAQKEADFETEKAAFETEKADFETEKADLKTEEKVYNLQSKKGVVDYALDTYGVQLDNALSFPELKEAMDKLDADAE